MLTFNLKHCWYEKIQDGSKRVEYRAVKPYWTVRLKKLGEGSVVVFKSGYGSSRPTLFANVIKVDIGPCPYDGWVGSYYRIWFVLRDDYPTFMDPTRYYPGYGVDDLNIVDFFDQRSLLEDDCCDDEFDDDFEE